MSEGYPDPDDLLWDYSNIREQEAELAKSVRVIVEPDGSVTMAGLDYGAFNSLLCAASLYRYDEDEKPSHSGAEFRAAKAKIANGGYEDWHGQLDILERNAHDDRLWRNSQRALLNTIDKAKHAALNRHNEAYGKVERIYYQLTSWTWRPRLFVWKWRQAIARWVRSHRSQD